MLKSIIDNTAEVHCNSCSNVIYFDLTNVELKYSEEFGEYENFAVECGICNTAEIFNMNIPVNDTDEPFATGDLPTEEEIQRYYVRLLQRIVREDFK